MAFVAGKIIVGFGIFLILCNTGKAIKCYQCNSHNDTRCSDEKIPADFLKECIGKSNGSNRDFILCRKIKQSIDFEVNGLPPETRIVRSCGFIEGNYKNRCYHKSGYGSRQEVCACDQDGCNSGNLITTSAVLLCSVILTLLF